MPEPFSAEHLNQLRQRWERDPKSRAFLQLAEEYRRAGRLPDAVHVLQAGLKEHPTYLSAQVALGRCLMETGVPDAAAEILERAVARDPTQLVANKLLVEAYLAKGQAEKASERLNLYKLFNDRDAEIEPLEARIRVMQGLPAVAPTSKKSPARTLPVVPAPPTAPPPASPHPPAAGAPFDLPTVAELPEMDLEPVLAAHLATGARGPAEPFGQLYAPGAAQRIESALAQQGIFPLAPPAPSAAPVAPFAPLAPFTPSIAAPPPAPIPAPAPVAAPVESPAAAPAPPEREEDWAFESSLLPVSEAPKAASATLGELYLSQGHLEEAEESFRSVLQARPGDAAALAGLESVRLQRGEEASAFADESPAAEESNVIVGGLTARKAALLKDYLARFRRGVKRHVS